MFVRVFQTKKLQQNCPLNYVIISLAAMATWFIIGSGTFICMDAIQIIIFHRVITQPIDGLMVVSLPGPHYGSSPINSLFAIWHLWWVSGEYHTKYSCLFRCPLWVTKFINYHFKLLWLNQVLIINLEDNICYTSFLFLLYYWQW